MKASNIAITAVLVVVSAFLLWLWYYLGFSTVDSVTDVVAIAVWWAVIVIGIVAVVRFERSRRRRIRTAYVVDDGFFNSEAGMVARPAAGHMADAIASTVGALRYGFGKADLPAARNVDGTPRFRYIVRTEAYKPAGAQGAGGVWRGEVVDVATGSIRPFSSRQELAAVIG